LYASTQLDRHRRGEQRVPDLVPPRDRQRHGRPLRCDDQRVRRAPALIQRDVHRAHGRIRCLTGEHDPSTGTGGHRADPLVVGVEHGDTVGWQRLDEFAL
jgi:hypothetical protein